MLSHEQLFMNYLSYVDVDGSKRKFLRYIGRNNSGKTYQRFNANLAVGKAIGTYLSFKIYMEEIRGIINSNPMYILKVDLDKMEKFTNAMWEMITEDIFNEKKPELDMLIPTSYSEIAKIHQNRVQYLKYNVMEDIDELITFNILNDYDYCNSYEKFSALTTHKPMKYTRIHPDKLFDCTTVHSYIFMDPNALRQNGVGISSSFMLGCVYAFYTLDLKKYPEPYPNFFLSCAEKCFLFLFSRNTPFIRMKIRSLHAGHNDVKASTLKFRF